MNKVMQAALERQRHIERLVLPLCEAYGFGAVMDAAASQWRERDPHGALTVGPPAQAVAKECGWCEGNREDGEICACNAPSPTPDRSGEADKTGTGLAEGESGLPEGPSK